MINPITFLSKIFKSTNQKELERISKIVKKINSLEENFKKLKDDEFPIKTKELNLKNLSRQMIM